MEITYRNGPRYIDGENIDIDANAEHPSIIERDVADPVTGLHGMGYQPGQKNLDGSEL